MEAVAAKGWFGERADDGRGKESEGYIIVIVVGAVRCVEGKGKSYVGFRAFVCGVLFWELMEVVFVLQRLEENLRELKVTRFSEPL